MQLDSSDPSALEKAMRIYNGKPLINSVNGKQESMDSVFPLIKKYGGAVIALTLDESGIPETVQGRMEIAYKILREAEKYGICKEDVIFDPLTMAVSTDNHSAEITLECIDEISNKLGCKTSLGVSNISFGLPGREILNSSFFNMALSKGLSAAIINPYSKSMMDVYYSYCALTGNDAVFSEFIEYCNQNYENSAEKIRDDKKSETDLISAIFNGRKEQSSKITGILLESTDGLTIINDYIIPALNKQEKNLKKESFIFLSFL